MPRRLRGRLFLKYVGLFVAVVSIALLSNGAFEVWFSYQTTKPAGEGTGLGLSLSHDIVVKQHGGEITVATKPGEFTEFTIVLPRAAPTGAPAIAPARAASSGAPP